MDVPESLGLPALDECETAILEVVSLEGLACELPDTMAIVCNLGTKSVPGVHGKAVQRGVESYLPFAYRCVHLHIGDTRAYRCADEVHITAQAAACHRALHLSGRGGVAVREHDGLQRHGFDKHTENVRGARAAVGRDVELATWENDGSYVPTIQINSSVGVQVIGVDCDTPADPFGGNDNLPLVPGRGDAVQIPVFPGRVGIDCLAVFLHVVGDSRPAPRYLKVAPPVGGHDVRVLVGRLPAPQAIYAYPLARGR